LLHPSRHLRVPECVSHAIEALFVAETAGHIGAAASAMWNTARGISCWPVIEQIGKKTSQKPQ
jgi:hypothetical protein